jgi:hypothetical protein
MAKIRKCTRQELLSVIGDKSWRDKNKNKTKGKKISHVQNYRKNLLSPIPSTLTSLLQPSILLEGNDI